MKKDVTNDFINAFSDAAVNTLKTQCDTVITPSISSITEMPLTAIEIAGVVSISTSEFIGNISICFPKTTFLNFMSKMIGDTFSEITDDLADGAGELLNIIYGSAKISLNEKDYKLEKALPSIIKGNQISILQNQKTKTSIIKFDSNAGSFYIQVNKE